ncbi:MAG: hypothetical protein D6766_11825 [Verrucomicrobia bacterium]|nr:MAG: hypothetical protein D6766_11825 [Verrucomicrobiota bacterium]
MEDVDPEHRVTPVNQATLVINPGVVPEHRVEFITPLWLAYASAFYFPQGKNEARLPPIYPLGETPEARQLFVATATPVLTRWKLDDQSPHLPRQVDILREGRVFVVEGELTSHRAPSWFREHESAYAYRTLTWTNLGDLRIPLSFEVTRENLVSGWQGDGGRSITAKAVFTGSLQTATLGASVSSFIPQIPEVTRVEENRLAVAPEKVRGITYLTKKGRILPLSEVRTLDAFQWAARQQGRPLHHTRLQVWYGIFVMVVALVPLATLLVRKTIPHAKKHQNH